MGGYQKSFIFLIPNSITKTLCYSGSWFWNSMDRVFLAALTSYSLFSKEQLQFSSTEMGGKFQELQVPAEYNPGSLREITT